MKSKKISNRYDLEIETVNWYAQNPKAVVVLAHGASEHIYRYDHFASFLQANEISVIGYNHVGHGATRALNDVYFADKDGDKLLVSNLEDVCLHAYQTNSDIPIILMGHSMGSIIARALTIDTKLMLDGVIICGSLHPTQSLIKSGKTLATVLKKIRGAKSSSKMLNNIAFGKLEDTLSFNNDNVENYIQDKDAGMLFTNGAILDLMKLIDKIIDPINISKMIPTNYFIISGKKDPFSKETEDLYPFLQLLNSHKFVYTYKFYDNMKHEILNESDNTKVYNDILDYINRRVENLYI